MLVRDIIPVEALVPDAARKWRPLVEDSFQYIFSHLSEARVEQKFAEQMELPAGSPPEKRLIKLISKMPGLQKLGQVLARNRRISVALRTALIELENGMCDATASEIRAILANQLGERLDEYSVRLENTIYSEASVSAVVRFTWRNPDRERKNCVFKVLKPYVRKCFAEDMSLLQGLANYLARRERRYGSAIRDVDEMITEVRLLLERELDFSGEQKTLIEARRAYRSSLGIRVPEVIEPLCTAEITAMSEESGVKVTEAFRRSPIRRTRIAGQLVDALIATPLFSGRSSSVFHADPHAGNLLYDEPNRELIVLDWALAERLSRESRRHVILLGIMMILRNAAGVRQAIHALRVRGPSKAIDTEVNRFFAELRPDHPTGILDAMRLLDQIALQGVHFPAPLFLFRKSLFTLDGVLQDIAGTEVRIDHLIARHFLTRWAGSFGLLYSPLALEDFISVEWQALLYQARRLIQWLAWPAAA